MRCMIIDDEATARLILEKVCETHDDIEVVASMDSAIEGLKYLNQNNVDLILLDIQMPNFNGIDFVQTLKEAVPIICVTSDRNFAVDAFEYDNIIAYLLKPIDENKFAKAIEKAKRKSSQVIVQSTPNPKLDLAEEKYLYVNIDRRLIKIQMDTIYMIEAKGDYILIKCDDQNHTVHSTLKKIESKLPKDLFLKVHRSFIINIQRIVDIEDGSVLINRDVIPVSRSKKPELMERLNLL